MLDSDNARIPSENTVHQLTGSSQPGDAPMLGTSENPFMAIGDVVPGLVAGLADRMPGPSEIETIALANEAFQLIDLEEQAVMRRAWAEERCDELFPVRPKKPHCEAYEVRMSLDPEGRTAAEMREHLAKCSRVGAAALDELHARITAQENYEAECEAIRVREGLAEAEQEADALNLRLVSAVELLTVREPQTPAGLAAKSRVAVELMKGKGSLLDDWMLELAASAAIDTVRVLSPGALVARPPASPSRDVCEAYRTLLHFELRRLNMELDGTPEGHGSVWLDNAAAHFHFPNADRHNVPPPSSRAAVILDLFGIDWRAEATDVEEDAAAMTASVA